MTFHADNYYKVSLRDLKINMALGIADWEQGITQDIIINVDMYQAMDQFTGTSIEDCINYVSVFDHVTQNWPHRPHTDLLETLCEELVTVCFKDPKVAACRVSIQKPQVFKGVATPDVSFFRQRKQ